MGRDERLSAGAWRAFAILSSYADPSRRCFPSQTRIAKDLGASRTTSQRWIDELERAGWIIRRHQIRPHKGGWGVNAYLVAPFPFPQVTSVAQDYARIVGNGEGVTERDAREPSLSVGIAMPTTEHEHEQSDAHDHARTVGTNRPSSQTLEVTDPLAQRPETDVARVGEQTESEERTEQEERELRIASFHRGLDHDRRVTTERSLWGRLVDAKSYSREEAALVMARGHVAGLRPGPTFDAAPSAQEWRRQEARRAS